MSLLSFFFPKKEPKSSSVAKERLQIIIARESNGSSPAPNYLPQLQKELLDVIRKYTHVDESAIKVSLDRQGNLEVLDVNVVLPDAVPPAAAPAVAAEPVKAAG